MKELLKSFEPLDKLKDMKIEKQVTIEKTIWDNVIVPVITCYELDGNTIIIHTDREHEYSFEIDLEYCIDFHEWISNYKGMMFTEVPEFLDTLSSDDMNYLAEMYAKDNCDLWKYVEP